MKLPEIGPACDSGLDHVFRQFPRIVELFSGGGTQHGPRPTPWKVPETHGLRLSSPYWAGHGLI
jgi:hypothetical protein